MTDRDKIIETMARGIAQEIAQPSYSHLDEVPGRDAAHAAVSGLAQAALTALQASGMAVVPGWQSIESAPKGEVLLYYPAIQNGHPSNALNEWIVVGYAGGTTRKPSHWQPLPTSPSFNPVVQEKMDE